MELSSPPRFRFVDICVCVCVYEESAHYMNCVGSAYWAVCWMPLLRLHLQFELLSRVHLKSSKNLKEKIEESNEFMAYQITVNFDQLLFRVITNRTHHIHSYSIVF